MGNKPNKADNLSAKDEDILWEKGQLGCNTPEALLNTVWYNNTKLFGFRGSDENRQLKWGDLEMKIDEEGAHYLVFNERSTKTRDGNSGSDRAYAPKMFENFENKTKCPINAYKLYKSQRPISMCTPEAPFYLAVNGGTKYKDTALWYKSQPIGVNKLGKMMKEMAFKSGLIGKKTNHSLRKTACTKLLHANVAPTLGTQFSGHKNLASFSNYATASFKQQKEISHILQDCSTKQNQIAIPEKPQKQPRSERPAESVTPMKPTSMENMASGLFSGASITGGTFNINFQIHSQKNYSPPRVSDAPPKKYRRILPIPDSDEELY